MSLTIGKKDLQSVRDNYKFLDSLILRAVKHYERNFRYLNYMKTKIKILYYIKLANHC